MPGIASAVVCAVLGVVLLPAVTIPTPAQADPARPGASVAVTRLLTGHRWHYRAQIDGRGGRDRITITAQPGFTLSGGFGLGQVLVHVDFAGHRGFAEIQQELSYYSVRTPWTPWLGAADLDRRGGKEIVLGFSTGAHAQLFTAYSYRSNGELLTLRAPHRADAWMVNSSFGTGTSGWRCTARGVQSRSVASGGGRSATSTVTSYVMRRNGEWRRTRTVVRTVRLDARGNPPASTASYGRFACRGLPKQVL